MKIMMLYHKELFKKLISLKYQNNKFNFIFELSFFFIIFKIIFYDIIKFIISLYDNISLTK